MWPHLGYISLWASVSKFSYLDKLYQWKTCRAVTLPRHHRWRRGCRAPENSPGPSTCPRCTPHTPCHGQTHSWTACPGLQGTWCRVHTAERLHPYSSCSCTHRWRRWSLCRAPSCGGDLCRLCTADISLCDWSFLRRFHLKGEEREKLMKFLSDFCFFIHAFIHNLIPPQGCLYFQSKYFCIEAEVRMKDWVNKNIYILY